MSQDVHKYFVPGYGISRIVIQSAIASYCGPGSIARPYVYRGRDGFLVTTSARALTQRQIEDLKAESLRYEEQQAEKSSKGEIKSDDKSANTSDNGCFINEPVEIDHR